MPRPPRRPAKPRPASAAAGGDPAEAISPPRIVGGHLRGRRLAHSPDGRTRPMKDRVRESLFDLIGTDVRGALALDLFAGTGALGFEAVSRGAAKAVFVERHFPTADMIRRSATELGVADRCEVKAGDVLLWPRRMPDLPRDLPWIAFVSPPWSFFAPDHPRHADLMALIDAVDRAAPPGSVIAVEGDTSLDPALLPAAAAIFTDGVQVSQGQSALSMGPVVDRLLAARGSEVVVAASPVPASAARCPRAADAALLLRKVLRPRVIRVAHWRYLFATAAVHPLGRTSNLMGMALAALCATVGERAHFAIDAVAELDYSLNCGGSPYLADIGAAGNFFRAILRRLLAALDAPRPVCARPDNGVIKLQGTFSAEDAMTAAELAGGKSVREQQGFLNGLFHELTSDDRAKGGGCRSV